VVGEGEFANGFLIQAEVLDPSKVMISDGLGSTLAQPRDCRPFSDGANCTIIVVSNGSSNPPSEQPGVGFVDTHFEVLYALLDDQRLDRLVPFLKVRRPLEGGPGDPPGSKCFGGLLEQ